MPLKLIRHTVVEPGALPPRLLPSEESNISYEYMFGEGGVYLRATLPDFELRLPWLPGQVNGLQPLTPYLRLNFPRIPASLVEFVFDKARTAKRDGQLIESLFYFRYEREAETWHVRVPPQHATSVRVVPTDTGSGSDYESASVELHSHHDLSLGARFSGRDNRDEKTRARLFAVIGLISSDEPEIRARAGVFGHYFEIPANTLFELPAAVRDSRDKDVEYEQRAAAALFSRPVDSELLRSPLVRGLRSLLPAGHEARGARADEREEEDERDEAQARLGA